MTPVKAGILIAGLLLLAGARRAEGQISVTVEPDAMMAQHWAMPTLLDPASTGEIDFIRIRGGARMDYLGSHESPKNYLAAADSPFKLFGKRIGAGLIFNSKSYDLWRNLQVSAQGSYKLQIKKSTISIGLQIGYYHTKFKGSEMIQYNQSKEEEGDIPGEELFTREDDPEEGPDEEGTGTLPGDTMEYPTEDVAAGVFDMAIGLRYDHPLFHVGVSVQHLTNPKMKLTREGETATDTRYLECKLPMTLYFDAGGNIGINNTLFTLQPSLLLATDFKDFRGLVEMRATYKKMLTFGVDYRWNRAAGIIAGLSIKNFYVGYSWEYDYAFHPHGSTGNHELVLGYQFKMDMGGKNLFSHRSIRIM